MGTLIARPSAAADRRERALIEKWNSDISKAAQAAATRSKRPGSEDDDFAQDARIRLFTASRDRGPLSQGYTRSVIANAIRTSIHREVRTFSVWSPGANTEISDQLTAPEAGQREREASAVNGWLPYLPVRLAELYEHIYIANRSQREVARLMHLSQPRVAQLHARLLERGRSELAFMAP